MSQIRILTYNVHSCIGTDRKVDPARVARVIAACEPDIVGLQELDVGRRRTGGVDQVQAIARELSMDPHFHAALSVKEERYGDAILSRLPSRLIKAAPLPSAGEPRGALAVEVDVHGRSLVVINTHLGLSRRERTRQAETLLGAVWLGHEAMAGLPAVLMGDFNARPRSAAFRLLARHLTDAAALRPSPTFPSRWPLIRIDHVFIKGNMEVRGSHVVDDRLARTASDHLPLAVDLTVG